MDRVAIVVLLVGCASEARLPASYFGEGARALGPGHVAVSGAGGAGATSDGSGAGVGGRIRVGVGGDQEVGVEAAEEVLDSPSEHCTFDCQPGENQRYTTRSRSALVSWKKQVRPSLALVAGAGVARHEWIAGDPDPVGDYKGLSINGSFGLVGSRRLQDWLEIYMGARLVAAAPIRQDPMVESHSVLGVSAAVGGMVQLSSYLGMFAELGPRGSLIVGDGITIGGTAVAGLSLTL